MRIFVTGGANGHCRGVQLVVEQGKPGFVMLRGMGYAPRIPFAGGLRATVDWYTGNRTWREPLKQRTQ